MANPPRQKGTAGETELLRILQPWVPDLVRAPASSIVDLKAPGKDSLAPIEILATRPDRGRWLMTMEADTFGYLWETSGPQAPLDIEVKRYAKFAHHAIWELKFGDKRAS